MTKGQSTLRLRSALRIASEIRMKRFYLCYTFSSDNMTSMKTFLLLFAFCFLLFPIFAKSQGFIGCTSRTMLIMRPEVKKEIKVTKDQDKAIQKAIEQMGQEAQSGAVTFNMLKPFGALDGKLPEILGVDQVKRLDELFMQFNAGLALTDEKAVKEIGISDEQLVTLTELEKELTDSVLAVARTSPKDMSKAIKESNKLYGEKMLAVLTVEQEVKRKELLGKPFKFKN